MAIVVHRSPGRDAAHAGHAGSDVPVCRRSPRSENCQGFMWACLPQRGKVVNVTDAAHWLTLPDVADRLSLSIVKVNQLIKDGSLLAVRRDGIRQVPAELVANETVLKHLPGVLTLLHDAGF